MENRFKKGLGRGLSSLLGENIEKKVSTNKVLIKDIKRNQFQPRKSFNKENLEDLTNSIKEQGVIQPILVRPDKNDDGKYEIIAGERRWLASQNAGLHEVPVVILDVNDEKSLEFAIVENVQRQDLNSVEEARGYQRLIDEFNYNQDKLSKFIGKSRSYIANLVRMLTLPNEILIMVEKGDLSAGHARTLIGIQNSIGIAKKIIEKKLSVRQAENLIRVLKFSKNSKSKSRDPNIINLEENVESKTGLKVKIHSKKNNSGSVLFEYRDNDQLNHLLMIIKDNY